MALFDDIKAAVDSAFDNSAFEGMTVSMDATFAWSTGGAYDPATGVETGATAVSVTTKAFLKNFTRGEVFFGGGSISLDDIRLVVRGYKFPEEPPRGARVTFDGREYELKALDRKSLNGEPFIYAVHLGHGFGPGEGGA